MHCSSLSRVLVLVLSLVLLHVTAATDDLQCKTELQAKVLDTFQANADAFRQCSSTSSYQIFPYPGSMPSTLQTVAICGSAHCAVLMNKIATFPDCELAGTPLRRVGLVMRQVCEAFSRGVPVPGPRQIADLINNYQPPAPVTAAPSVVPTSVAPSTATPSSAPRTTAPSPAPVFCS
ncbi:hypothetical protein SPRG_04087 [Saprolegnia parasitica CBS 223.65]|uniref:Elicitin n=1 Tax=Saprolegnia parasitica (strain CBS 223.65) TaxID=695850 RepID=A0A067CXD6_SAPPC|nr:hypothetical protein SPRG_04087 [Saprolegnia parasitica CBS 223.65]KDO31472.1 hypothetical protein SPRG_04087 [Saprolegnia parasitica CBS 223.65]|eukprot:XP_012198065.1 hypothetical protein SPRG_04087 [Saprolegnia parasitica CBS 223.65]